MQKEISIGGLMRDHGESYINRNHVDGQEKGLIRLLAACRTIALGSHYEKCDNCHYLCQSYNFPILGTGYAATGIALFASKKIKNSGCRNV
ncbi:MAG: hypothetical protein U9R19_03595 [Bacteroidota bacterium]|nr:hypothetical protein [Bacteroidota bacterium]